MKTKAYKYFLSLFLILSLFGCNASDKPEQIDYDTGKESDEKPPEEVYDSPVLERFEVTAESEDIEIADKGLIFWNQDAFHDCSPCSTPVYTGFSRF